MSDRYADEVEVALAEYNSLRQEIDARAKRLHQILMSQLFVVGAVSAFALGTVKEPGPKVVLLVVPFTSFLLLGRFVDQQYAVNRIGRFLRDRLSPRIPGRLQWEEWAHENPRPQLGQFWMWPVMLAFPIPALLAVAFSFIPAFSIYGGMASGGLLIVWFIGLVLTLVQVRMVPLAIRDFRGAFPWQPDPRKHKSRPAEPKGGGGETAGADSIPAQPGS